MALSGRDGHSRGRTIRPLQSGMGTGVCGGPPYSIIMLTNTNFVVRYRFTRASDMVCGACFRSD